MPSYDPRGEFAALYYPSTRKYDDPPAFNPNAKTFLDWLLDFRMW